MERTIMETLIKIEEELGKMNGAIGEHKAQIKTLFERVNNLDKLVETVHSLAKSTEKLATNQGAIQLDVQSLRQDMDDIKSRPVKRWTKILSHVVFTALGILVGWVLKQFGIF